MGGKMRTKRPTAQDLRHYRSGLLFPHDLSIYLRLGPDPGKALAARNAVEVVWSRTGRGIGHGTDLCPDGECDTQVCFRTLEDVAAAKQTATEILRAAGHFPHRFSERTYSPEDCANMYGIRAENL